MGLLNIVWLLLPMTIMYGLASALGTLVAQSNGAGNIQLTYKYIQEQLNMTTLLYLIILPIIYGGIAPAFVAIGIDPETVKYAKVYLRYQVPGAYFFMIFQSYANYYISIERPMVPTMILVPFTILHYYLCKQLMPYFDMNGCAVAYNITYILCALVIYAFGRMNNEIPSFKITSDLTRKYVQLVREAMPLLIAEMWGYTSLEIFAGMLSVEDQDVMVIVYSISMIVCFVGMAYS